MHTESKTVCAVWIALLKLLIFGDGGLLAEELPEEQLCTGGVCVPYYLCSNGIIIENGEGLIDLRVGDTMCSTPDTVCCMPLDDNPTAEAACEGLCVPHDQCMFNDEEHLIDLRLGQKNCSENFVCCRSMVVQYQGSESENLCEGKCVPLDQCTNETGESFSDSEKYDLRSYDQTCPTNLVCCRELMFENVNTIHQNDCQCVPFYDCLDDVLNTASLINLRLSGDECPDDQTCCTNPRPAISNNEHLQCKGSCVPLDQCPNVLYSLIDLRGNVYCAQDEICCTSEDSTSVQLPQVCEGKCVPLEQCHDFGLDEMIPSITVNICPLDLVCCPNVEPEIIAINEETKKCACVSTAQCADPISGINGIDLRHTECPDNQICCLNILNVLPTPEKFSCDDSCVPEYQCKPKSSEDRLDLRIGGECPNKMVCCKTSDLITSINHTCEENCVPRSECLTVTEKDLIDIRLGEICPEGLVCCKDSQQPICDGSCVSTSMCLHYGYDSVDQNLLSSRKASGCSDGEVCCENVRIVAEDKPSNNICAGTCVTVQECNDNSIENTDFQGDIRRQTVDNGCSGNLVCCENPLPKPNAEKSWTQWITDINNMIEHDGDKDQNSCLIKFNPNYDTDGRQDFPWLVTVWSKHDTAPEEYRCLGTLVKADAVLTSADCVNDLPHTQLFVRFGTQRAGMMANDTIVPVLNILLHPDYRATSNDNNIGLLILHERPLYNYPIACLFEHNEQFDGDSCVLISWDGSSGNRSSTTGPRQHRVALQSSDQCQPGLLCTTNNEWSRNCINFQGAPLMCQAQFGQWKQAGLVMKHNIHCDAIGVPKSILGISKFYPWINEQFSPSFVQKPRDQLSNNQYLPAS